MKLSFAQIERFENFLTRIQRETYPEYPSEIHESLTKSRIEEFLKIKPLPLSYRPMILDIGCGQGVALEIFLKRGFKAIGITINQKDFKTCLNKELPVSLMDQSFLEFPAHWFDLIWCRHCLEHSPFPLFTLSEFSRVLKSDGLLYVEVPAPDTDCQHQTNANHYSVFGRSMWVELFKKAGFTVLDSIRTDLKTMAGPDIYWSFYLEKA